MADEHEMRPECAQNFGQVKAEIRALRAEDGVSRDEFRILREDLAARHQKIMDALSLVREDVSALKVKASAWGALGGALTAIVAGLVALITLAFR
jgi:5-bromo-4-chloroindolyl phosphate hydrolysis protein